MSNVLIGVVGIILFFGLLSASAFYYGREFSDRRLEAEALRLVSERGQIEAAVDQFIQENGEIPAGSGGVSIMQRLTQGRYLLGMPPGSGSGWGLYAPYEAIMTPVAPDEASEKALQLCIIARENANMPSPSNVYRCDGSDHPNRNRFPDGQKYKALGPVDPCCLG